MQKAVKFAEQAHGSIGQTRKYSGEPYIVHPLHVMHILSRYSSQPVSAAMLAAAACHDCVEDTHVTLDQIKAELGSEVAELVNWLTNVSKPEHGNRRVRKALDLAHTQAAPAHAKSIKCADLISNAVSITNHDPGFARVWLREMEQILDVCQDADPALLANAKEVLHYCQQLLRNHTPGVGQS